MSPQEFATQINRLCEVFGEKAYPNERTKLIFREVKDYSLPWFQKVVDDLISRERLAPLLPQFYEFISRERERVWKIEKEQHAKEAKEFMSRFDGADVQAICKTIVDRINGKVTDSSFQSFLNSVTESAEGSECGYCGGTGSVVMREKGGDTAWRCRCRFGNQRNSKWPIYLGSQR